VRTSAALCTFPLSFPFSDADTFAPGVSSERAMTDASAASLLSPIVEDVPVASAVLICTFSCATFDTSPIVVHPKLVVLHTRICDLYVGLASPGPCHEGLLLRLAVLTYTVLQCSLRCTSISCTAMYPSCRALLQDLRKETRRRTAWGS
jgi:hypothetical protein